ncbi:IclR family transcriptional regulator [Propionimicrobium sp. PCR01-08-3]|uniref:IclR family transcriptional regulator n=1 Tax=Propionimicrobium sp. PCR01-08-3 TaxID=3052086 RepID=UPI00255C9C90|nr:IclR family transcriptional regulator [Propionimicrobium sp. PCR01-08-3]WIY82545.1 IclR family transcriptional regulator [Propionimicrobium sp. PCR01-08-3]
MRASSIEVPPRGSPSVTRAVAVLNLIAGRPGGWSLTQISSSLGLAKSSVLTILTSLEAAGMVSRTDNFYELDIGVLTPAGGFLRGTDSISQFKREVAAAPLLSGELAHLAVLAGSDVTYIARHVGREPLPVTAGVGDRFPASITAVGVALLAQLSNETIARLYRGPDPMPRWSAKSTRDLPGLLDKLARTREQGYSVDDGETYHNVFAYGLVVHRVGNHAQDFSMSVSMLRDQTTAKRKAQALEELMGVRDALEAGNDLR